MRAKLDCAGATDVGRSRATNQDHFLIADLKKSMLVNATSLPLTQQSRLFGGSMGRLLMVADGMGGHAAGERASTLAMDYLGDSLLNRGHWCFNLDRDAEGDLRSIAAELDLSPQTLHETLDSAMAVGFGRPRISAPDDQKLCEIVSPHPPTWSDVIDDAVRLPTGSGTPGPI